MVMGQAGLAVMAIATPAPTAKAPPAEQIAQTTVPDDAPHPPIEVPAPPIVALFALAAGALLIRRKFF